MDNDHGQSAREMLDPYHQRASVSDGERMMLNPGQVLDNIAEAMERVDLDPDVEISIEEDVVGLSEMVGMIEQLGGGPLVVAHVANTSLRILSARYPRELVRTPLPPQYDLRKLTNMLQFEDGVHAIAVDIYNQRLAASTDLEPEDVAETVLPLSTGDQIQVFVALFYTHNVRCSAIKSRSGIA